ncbi:MAG: hypothetical protein WCO60_03000 [Verrucomicrobiota bacterium]
MCNSPVARIALGFVLLVNCWEVPAVGAPPKPEKTRLVPRPLPGDASRDVAKEEHITRKPFVEGGQTTRAESLPGGDRARIVMIHRGGGVASAAADGKSGAQPAVEDGKDGSKPAPALRPGQIRILPKTDAKPAVVCETSAPREP